MQKQKDEVRARIVDAATSEFTQYGYQKSSMRRLAQRAHITPGNIYAYFGGKQDLFDSLIGPTVQQLDDRIFSISKGKAISLPTIEQMTDAIAHIFLCNRTQFLILMQGSEMCIRDSSRPDGRQNSGGGGQSETGQIARRGQRRNDLGRYSGRQRPCLISG